MAKPWGLFPRKRRRAAPPPMVTGPDGESRSHPRSKRDREGRLWVHALWVGAPPTGGSGPVYIECPHCWAAHVTEALNAIATQADSRMRTVWDGDHLVAITYETFVEKYQADGMCSYCGAMLALRIIGQVPSDHPMVREIPGVGQ